MKKTLVALLVVISIIVGLGAGAIAALWLFPEAAVSLAARAVRSRGIRLETGSVRGNPAAGWTIENLSLSGAAFDIGARRLWADVNWRSTALGRPALDGLWAGGLNISVRPSTATARPPGEPKAMPPLLPIHDLRLDDGAFSLARERGEPFQVDAIDLRAAVSRDRIDIDSLGATVRNHRIEASGHFAAPASEVVVDRVTSVIKGSTVTGRGRFDLRPFGGTFTLASEGPLALRADFTGDGKQWRLSASGAHGVSRLDASASMDFGTELWSARLAALGVPADLVPGLPPSLGALTGTLQADGRGKAPGRLNGQGRLVIVATNGPRLAGDVAIDDGNVRAGLKISSGGVAGRLDLRWNLAAQRGRAGVDLNLAANGLARWLPFSSNGALKASLAGPRSALAWTLDADLTGLRSGRTMAAAVKLNGRGPSLAPPEGRLTVDIAGLRSGAQVMEAAAVSVDGTLPRHDFELSLSREGARLTGAGSASLKGAEWDSRWTRLEADLGQMWRLAAPFRLSAGAAGARVDRLHIRAEKGGSLMLQGGIAGGRFRALRISGDGLRLDPMAKLAGIAIPVAGVANVEASLTGALKSPDGFARIRVKGLSIDQRPAGDVDAEARLDGRRIHVDRLALATEGGRLDVSGVFPLSLAGRRAPPFTLHVKTAGLDPSALPVSTGGFMFETSLLTADIRIAGRGRQFSADGWLNFTARRISDGKKNGFEVKDVHLRLAGDGKTLTVERGTMKGGDGTANLAGSVSPKGANLLLEARDFELRHSAGIYAKLDSDMTLKSPWSAPHVAGRIDITKGEFKPAKKEKKKDARAEPSGPAVSRPRAVAGSPLSLDIEVVFDRDVWFREGQTAIEMKGDLDIRKDAGAPTLLFGTLESIRGDYYFYGRAFTLENGRVLFAGELPPDPRLQVRALHHNESTNVKVWIEATGRLRDPRITLSSQPPMEETDIIAVLVTGRPLGAESQGAGTEAMARSLAANYLGEKVRQQLQDKIAIDVLKFSLNRGGGGDVTIGDRVTEDLYVSYGQSLGADAERRVNAEYEITPRFSLQGTTSSVGRYVIDLLFRFGFY